MQIASAGSAQAAVFGGKASSYTESQVAQIDKQFKEMLSGGSDDPAEMLKEITSGGMKGYWAWQVKQLRAKAAEKILGQRNLTPEMIAALPPQQRADIEKQIMQEVERMVKQMIEEELKRKGKDAGLMGVGGNVGAAGNTALDIVV